MENIENSFIDLPNPRKDIEDLQPYSAPLEGRRNLLRLDFNENTIGPSPLVIKSLREISRDEISVYPEYSGLKEKVVSSINMMFNIIAFKFIFYPTTSIKYFFHIRVNI